MSALIHVLNIMIFNVGAMVKKVFFCMFFYCTSVLYGSVSEPMPSPVVDLQALHSVQSFSGYFLQYILLLLQRLASLHSEDRELIHGAFIVEAQRGYIPQRNEDCDAIVINVIKAKVFNETWSEANKYLQEPGPIKIANSMASNVHIALHKNGIYGHVISPYMGNELRMKVVSAVGHSAYDKYRR